MESNNHPVAAPAPWFNKGEAYIFFLPTPATLPNGAYGPTEAGSPFASTEAGTFRGGLGNACVQVVRYFESPVGPYDELLYIPGKFDIPTGKAHLRVTRIYVSTEASIYNGRKNWNIPKYLARFAFTRTYPEKANSPIRIEAFPPAPADRKPFFSAIATPSTWIPSFPVNTRYIPQDTLLVHPPLPHQTDACQWISTAPLMRGKSQIVWYTPGGEGEGVPTGDYADGDQFPKITPWSMGVHITKMLLDFPVGQVVEDKKTK
ncbi:hypothetical protein K439DRAFT_1408197 [Ramaria rubella]|nr:hypothetical protein K439DRAFT_1408197 [Ramaria rubella]